MSTAKTISLKRLSVEGVGKISAELTFEPGLNVIVGASNTGKSYIFQTIDHLLGGSKPPPEDNPFAKGYNRANLTFVTSDTVSHRIGRIFGDAKVHFQSSPKSDFSAPFPGDLLPAALQKEGLESLSGWLLTAIGLSGHHVRANAQGRMIRLSFRNIAHLAMIDENRIIAYHSPATTGQRDAVTEEQRVLNLLITGIGDVAEGAPSITRKERDLSVDAQIDWVNREIEEKSTKFKALVDPDLQLDDRILKIDAGIQLGTEIVSGAKERIAALESRRKDSWTELVLVRERLLVVKERLQRFKLLLGFYKSDSDRLLATLEAGAAFERLSSGHCAVCGQFPEQGNEHQSPPAVARFSDAATRELEKLKLLTVDLKRTIQTLEMEEQRLTQSDGLLVAERKEIDAELQHELKPQQSLTGDQLRELLRLKSELSRAKDLQNEIQRLGAALVELEVSKKRKLPKPIKHEKYSERSVAELCSVITSTLVAWKFPISGDVTFDPKKFDLIINQQGRDSLGKGHRAITHAAFTIGLMRYCYAKSLPHPGFVVLDSPLNPFKGKSLAAGDGAPVSREIQDAFFEDLANANPSQQFIILENTDVQTSLLPRINHLEFTGDETFGRGGFFPPVVTI